MTGAATTKGGASSNRPTQRIDKWLWFARLVKTRTLGTRLVTTGKIRINSDKIDKPAQTVKQDDVITARIGRRVMVLKVVDTGLRRGPAPEAQSLYEDLTPPEPAFRTASPAALKPGKIGAMHSGKVAEREPGSGRPSKRERRQLNKLREDEN